MADKIDFSGARFEERELRPGWRELRIVMPSGPWPPGMLRPIPQEVILTGTDARKRLIRYILTHASVMAPDVADELERVAAAIHADIDEETAEHAGWCGAHRPGRREQHCDLPSGHKGHHSARQPAGPNVLSGESRGWATPCRHEGPERQSCDRPPDHDGEHQCWDVWRAGGQLALPRVAARG